MDPASNIWQVALALLAIVGVIVALGFVARRLQPGKGTQGGMLKVLDTTYLGPKERLVLVQVRDQHVLVAMNAQCITKLTQYQVEEGFSTVMERTSASAQGRAQ